jgi:hypothetical protein
MMAAFHSPRRPLPSTAQKAIGVAMKNPLVVSGGVPGESGPAIYRQKSLNRFGASSV